MLQVGAQETDLKTESHVQMVYLGVLSGLSLEGSQKSTTGQEERLNCNAVATEASANSMSSEAGTDSSRCCRLRQGDQAWSLYYYYNHCYHYYCLLGASNSKNYILKSPNKIDT